MLNTISFLVNFHLPVDTWCFQAPSSGNLANHDMSQESSYDDKMIILAEEPFDRRLLASSPGQTRPALASLPGQARPVLASQATVRMRPKSLQELTFRKNKPLSSVNKWTNKSILVIILLNIVVFPKRLVAKVQREILKIVIKTDYATLPREREEWWPQWASRPKLRISY